MNTGLKYYRCTKDSLATGSCEFERIGEDSTDNHSLNYLIDKETTLGFEASCDSTVWEKAVAAGEEKYVMIAELNSVVPEFALVVEPPTAEPISPYFDEDSTNVKYNLHIQK